VHLQRSGDQDRLIHKDFELFGLTMLEGAKNQQYKPDGEEDPLQIRLAEKARIELEA
jgi:hypothetical protein